MKGALEMAAMYGPARPLTEREAWEVESMLQARQKLAGPSHSWASDWLVRKAMSLKGWRSPYAWFKRTSAPKDWVLVSYHHPARLCWSWALSIQLGRRVHGMWRRPWFHYSGQFGINLPGIACIRFHRQPYDYMLSGNAEQLLTLLVEHAKETGRRAA